jgi:hypothetical protein
MDQNRIETIPDKEMPIAVGHAHGTCIFALDTDLLIVQRQTHCTAQHSRASAARHRLVREGRRQRMPRSEWRGHHPNGPNGTNSQTRPISDGSSDDSSAAVMAALRGNDFALASTSDSGLASIRDRSAGREKGRRQFASKTVRAHNTGTAIVERGSPILI